MRQFLHGYDDGHRLLAGSTEMDNQSLKLVQGLSDLPGQGTPPKDGYITGYPVSSLKAYAFAQTWLAPEMPRPGCVWTHTLLVSFSDLASLNDLSLLNYFRKPTDRHDFSKYTRELVLDSNLSGELPFPLSEDILKVMEQLYACPNDSVFVSAKEGYPCKELALAVWLYQWPKLRRNFRFCTWVPSDRSRPNAFFDLQFVSQQTHSLCKGAYVNLQDNRRPTEPWLSVFEHSNIKFLDGSNSLRSFMWRYGSETELGRAAFKPLVTMWNALERSSEKIDSSIPFLDLIPSIPSLSKKLLLKIAADASLEREVSGTFIDFIMDNLALFDANISEDEIKTISSAIWQAAPERIWELFRSNLISEFSIAAYAANTFMQPIDVLNGTAGDPELFGTIIKCNHKLAASPHIWNAPAPFPQIASGFIPNDEATAEFMLPVMFEADNPAVADLAVSTFGKYALIIAINKYSYGIPHDKRKAEGWLFAARGTPELLFHLMAQGEINSISVLEFIATLFKYNYQPVTIDTDAWASGLNVVHRYGEKLSFSFSAFLMARALCGVSPDAGTLICHSFESLHSDLMQSKLNYEAWRMLEQELPEVPFWDRWDNAKTLRLAVVEVFITRKLPLNDFMNITKDQKTLKWLIKAAASYPRGRQYLNQLFMWSGNYHEEVDSKIGISAGKMIKKLLNI